MLQAFEWVRRREERERGKGEKMSDALAEGAISTPSPTVGTTYVKQRQERRKMEVISKKKHVF
jgi:hypothetical protein